MTATQHGDERLLDHRVLPEDHIADRGLGGSDLRAGRFGLAHNHVFELFQPIAGYGHDVNSLLSTCSIYDPGRLVVRISSPRSVRFDQKTCNIRATRP